MLHKKYFIKLSTETLYKYTVLFENGFGKAYLPGQPPPAAFPAIPLFRKTLFFITIAVP
jgi:hypothetical protein